jgi:hypothetical protein
MGRGSEALDSLRARPAPCAARNTYFGRLLRSVVSLLGMSGGASPGERGSQRREDERDSGGYLRFILAGILNNQ